MRRPLFKPQGQDSRPHSAGGSQEYSAKSSDFRLWKPRAMHAHPSRDRDSQCLSSYFALTQKGMGLSKLSRGQGVAGSSVDKGENKARVVESGREKETEEE